jgi:plasmid stabilization system protein ParE
MYAEFHPDADSEFSEHAAFYEAKEPGLGGRFINEVEAGISALTFFPMLGQPFDGEFRQFFLDDFPFALVYRKEHDRIWIVAVAHQSRRPRYWRKRVGR